MAKTTLDAVAAQLMGLWEGGGRMTGDSRAAHMTLQFSPYRTAITGCCAESHTRDLKEGTELTYPLDLIDRIGKSLRLSWETAIGKQAEAFLILSPDGTRLTGQWREGDSTWHPMSLRHVSTAVPHPE